MSNSQVLFFPNRSSSTSCFVFGCILFHQEVKEKTFLFTRLTLQFHLLAFGPSGLDLVLSALRYSSFVLLGFFNLVCSAWGGVSSLPACNNPSTGWLLMSDGVSYVAERPLFSSSHFFCVHLRGEVLRGGGRGLNQEASQMSMYLKAEADTASL